VNRGHARTAGQAVAAVESGVHRGDDVDGQRGAADLGGDDWDTGGDATATQRVYEYAVEPAVLQNLPDCALLLAARGPAGPQLQALERDPAIATLPGLSARARLRSPGPRRPADAGRAGRLVSLARSAVQIPLPTPDAAIGGTAPAARDATAANPRRRATKHHRPPASGLPAVPARTHTIGASGPGGIEPAGRTAVH
jgi:hypothetical protein